MNNKPLANVKVSFHPDPDKGTSGAGSSGVTDAEGNFTLQFSAGKPGAIVGHHRVVLEDQEMYGNVFVGRGDYRTEDAKSGRMPTPTKPRFADKYTQLANTPFKQEVTVGMGPITLDVK